MSDIKIAIPLHGKMAARAFHQPFFRQKLAEGSLKPLYFLSPYYYRALTFDPTQYFELQVEQYDAQYNRHFLLQQLRMLRRFVIVTETTDMRFREMIETKLFDATLPGMAAQMIYVSALRRIPHIGRFLAWLEKRMYPTHAHDEYFAQQNVDCVLTPGMGNYNFWNEGNFAREAQRKGIPAFAAITNYDNIVNMGYRGFNPTCLAVWSRQMADEVIKLHEYPAKKLEVVGAVQYDRYLQPLTMSREEFLTSIGLDPVKKTVFFAGGVNVNHYFEIYRIFVEQKERLWGGDFNFIVRPQPHAKLLDAPGWQVVEKLFVDAGVYVSNPGVVDANGSRTQEIRIDLGMDDGPDELNYLLRYSDVLVNNFSTMGLEAAICDLPTIHIGYDAYTFGVKFGVTTGFQQRMTHNRRPLRLKASKVAKSDQQLLAFIEQYLNDRSFDREDRHEYAVSECGELDGMATSRLTDMIKSRMK
ncbi:MAG: hypothetical protein C4557_01670 [Anaerolineaceae bacterium]|jgi:hypothetical protein|nr:MAG: hypothetical protein C4557_01670 [Anaerolineaceae bacterium]